MKYQGDFTNTMILPRSKLITVFTYALMTIFNKMLNNHLDLSSIPHVSFPPQKRRRISPVFSFLVILKVRMCSSDSAERGKGGLNVGETSGEHFALENPNLHKDSI